MKVSLIIILSCLIKLISCQLSGLSDLPDFSSVEDLDSAKKQFEDSVDELRKFDLNSLSQSGQSSGDPLKCDPNKLIGSFWTLFVPDDYEQGEKMNIYAGVKHWNETIEKLNRLQSWASNISHKIKPIYNRLKARVSESLLTVDLPEECMTSMVRIAIGVYNMETWALQFSDAFPFTGSGMVEYGGFPTGGYDECLMIESPATGDDLPVIKGQYCPWGLPHILPGKDDYETGENKVNQSVVEWVNQNLIESQKKYDSLKDMPQRVKNFYLTTSFITEVFTTSDWSKSFDTRLPVGICIPTTCKPQDIEYAMNKVVYPIIRFPVAINPDCDYLDKPLEINGYQWTTISIFSALTLLVLLSTVYELSANRHKKSIDISFREQLYQSFSFITNLKSIFCSKRVNERFALLDGLRTILSFWVLLCHSHILPFLPFNSKRVEASTAWGVFMSKNYTHIKNINIIDTFFFIGGMMTCYVMLSKLSKAKGGFNYVQYVLYRYFRILPATFGAILLIFIFPLFGSGPFWTATTNILYIPCRDNWLSSVLMTSNIDISFPEKYICNTGNWYISSDFQLHLFAPILFLVLYFYPKVGVIWNIILIFVGVFIAIAPKVLWGIPHFFEYPRVDSIWTIGNLFITYYWRPDPHVVSYVFGIFCGYLIRQKPNLYFGGRFGEAFLWICCSAFTFGTMYWTNHLFDPYYDLTTTELLSFMAFSKLTYLIGWFWLFYACATGRGGFVNRFLSWKGFKSTSILSFEVCILHTMIILYRVGTARDAFLYSPLYVWSITAFDYLVTYLLSIVFYVLVSGPFANLVNIYMKYEESQQKLKD